MKKTLSILAISIMASFSSFSQEKSWAIKLNPLSAIVKTPNIQFEKSLNETSTAQLGIAYSGYSFSGIKYSFSQITPEYRKYLGQNGEAMRGFYAGPYLRARFGSFNDDAATSTKTTYTTIGGGIVLGYEKASDSGFVFDVFVGPNYGSTSYKSSSSIEDASSRGTGDGFGLRFGIALGFAK